MGRAALAVALTAMTALHAQTAAAAPTPPATAAAGAKPTRPAAEEREVTKLVRELRKALAGEARLAAAKALGLLGDRSAIPVLTDAVRTNPGDAFAYAALAELGVQPYLGDVTAAVRDGETPGILFTTYAAALASRGPKAAAPPTTGGDAPGPNGTPGTMTERLRTVWENPGEAASERAWAAATLHRLGDPGPAAFLAKLLGDPDPYVASVAAGALFAQGDPTARKVVTAILGDAKSAHWDRAAYVAGESPVRDLLPLLRGAHRRAKNPFDRVWLAWAILRTLDYEHQP